MLGLALRRLKKMRGRIQGQTGRGAHPQGRGVWPGPRVPVWGTGNAVRGTTLLPPPPTEPQTTRQSPQVAFPQPHHGLHLLQGSECWRKTGKPTKIFQTRQICGADKSRTGWDEVSVAPRWGGSVRSGLWPQKNASSPALSGAHCLSYPQKSPR